MKKAVMGLALVGVVLTGCSSGSKQNQGDAPRTGVINKVPADLIFMPDGYSNVATKCDHKNRLYVMFHGDSPSGSIFVVPNDPSCLG